MAQLANWIYFSEAQINSSGSEWSRKCFHQQRHVVSHGNLGNGAIILSWPIWKWYLVPVHLLSSVKSHESLHFLQTIYGTRRSFGQDGCTCVS